MYTNLSELYTFKKKKRIYDLQLENNRSYFIFITYNKLLHFKTSTL